MASIQVLRRVVEIRRLDLLGLVLREVLHAQLGHPVVLDEDAVAIGVDPLIGVDAGSLHLAVVRGNPPRAEQPGRHVRRFGREAQEIIEPLHVLAIGNRVRLERVHHVREFHRVADEKHFQVVADQVPVSVFGVELRGEASRIAQRLGRVSAVDDRREPNEDRRALSLLLKKLGTRVLADRLVAKCAVGFEEPVGASAAGMDDALGDPLAVEMGDLLEELIILQRRSARGCRRFAGSGCSSTGWPWRVVNVS